MFPESPASVQALVVTFGFFSVLDTFVTKAPQLPLPPSQPSFLSSTDIPESHVQRAHRTCVLRVILGELSVVGG